MLRNERKPGVATLLPQERWRDPGRKEKHQRLACFSSPPVFSELESLFLREKSGAAFFQPGVVLIGFCLKYLRDGNIKDELLSL